MNRTVLALVPLALAASILFGLVHPAGAQVSVTYDDGRGWNDERTQTMTLTFTGGSVIGTINTRQVCRPGVFLNGGSFTFTASLLGPWEDRGSVIRGTWSGAIESCGGPGTNSGTLEISMAATPTMDLGVRVLLFGIQGPTPYAFYYSPKNKVFVSGASQGVALSYQGGAAWADARSQQMQLNFSGPSVTGTLDTQNLCNANSALGGIFQRLTGSLRGNWENWGSLIFGTWGGDNKFCNQGPTPDRGHMCIFLGPGPRKEQAVIVRSLDENAQRYHFYYTGLANKAVDLGLSPAATAAGKVESQLVYEGKAWTHGITDARLQTLAMGIQGDRAFGTIKTTSHCSQNAGLAGGDFQFEGALDGSWESPLTTILGWWSGYKNPCAGEHWPDAGTFRISMGRTPEAEAGIILQLRSIDGSESAFFYPAKEAVAKSISGATDRFFRDAFDLCKFDLPGNVEVTDEGKDWTEGAGGKDDGPDGVGAGNDCPQRCWVVACPTDREPPSCSAVCNHPSACRLENGQCGLCGPSR
jgi:hypothetical protein